MNAAPAPLTGFYETFRTSGGRPHHWSYNLARLRRACACVGVEIPADSLALDPVRLERTVREILRGHEADEAVFRFSFRLPSGREEDLAVPPAFRAPGAGRVSEELHARPLPLPAPPDGLAVRVLGVARARSALQPRPKLLDDPDMLAASGEIHARAKAPGDEGLFLAREGGWVAETSRQNVLWFAGGRVFTPAPETGAVAGTGLAWLRDRGLAAEPVCAPLETLVAAEALAVCNSVRGLTPVRELWDATDRVLLRTYESAAHPAIVQAAAAWQAALARTAAGS